MARPPAQKGTLQAMGRGHAEAVLRPVPVPPAEHGDAEQPGRDPACKRGASGTPVPPTPEQQSLGKGQGGKAGL